MEKITIYSTPTCTYCIILKRYLDGKNVPYKEVDISKDEEAKNRMVEKTNQMTVPVTEIGDGKFIVGFKKKEIDEAILNLND